MFDAPTKPSALWKVQIVVDLAKNKVAIDIVAGKDASKAKHMEQERADALREAFDGALADASAMFDRLFAAD